MNLVNNYNANRLTRLLKTTDRMNQDTKDDLKISSWTTEKETS